MRRALVGDVMTADVVAVASTTTYNEIIRTLSRHRISGVPVAGPDHRVLGVVSESDLLRKEEIKSPLEETPPRFETPAHRETRLRAEGDTAAEVMTAPAVTIGQASTVVEAARLMAGRHHTRLPVIDRDGFLIGIVTRSDLLKVFVRSDEEIRDEVTGDVLQRYFWEDVSLVQVEVKDGVVTLSGHIDLKSLAPLLELLTSSVEGVVGIVNDLTYDRDDLETRGPLRT